MKNIKPRINFQALALAVGLAFFSISPAVHAQFNGQGLPGRREGAGTRGSCGINSTPSSSLSGAEQATPKDERLNRLMSVIPESNIGATLSEYPTFFWYAPASPLRLGQFTLYDSYGRNAKKVYETTLELKDVPGVVSFKLPSDGSVAPLELNRTYYWKFRIVCDTTDRSGDLLVEGFVQRVRPSATLEARLKQASERQRPTIYAAAGIWHETLSSLVQLKQKNPNDRSVQSDWNSLLRTINLDYLINEPITSCCRLPS